MEGSGQSLADLLARIVGPGLGLEIVSNVNEHPQRLAAGGLDQSSSRRSSPSACAALPARRARLPASSQGYERRLVAARAILGEWLGGSGGGWQDSGGVWPGMKLIDQAQSPARAIAGARR